jgi:vacuolar protein sorting-associated protein 33B
MCEAIMDKKKEIEFRSQMEVERNIIEASDYRESIQYLEEIIISQVCPLLSLRLLCLLSLIQDGLPSKDYYNLIKLFLQSFGHHYLIKIFRLKQLGLLIQQNQPKILSAVNPKVTNVLSQTKVAAAAISALPRKSHFRNVIKRLNLCPVSNTETKKTQDCSFIFGGNFVPLIYKIVDLIIGENPNLVDNFKIVSNHVIHKRLDYSDQGASRKKVVVVFFIGGLSYAEISALRFLARQKDIELMMCCSSIINGNRLMSLTHSNEVSK